MSEVRKPASAREKDLKLAIFRIEQGRANTKSTKVNFSTVASEAGVSASLIHNHYPGIAAIIRGKTDASALQQRDIKHQDLKEEKAKNKALFQDLKEAGKRIAQLASINECLLIRLRALESAAEGGNVHLFPPTTRKNS